jgi:serine/threonine protein kinase
MPSEINDLIGQVIGKYRLTSLLARGGMSVVFLGQSRNNLQSPVAIKILLPSTSFTPEARHFSKARFIREIRTTTHLHHEHILPVLDYGRVNELPYLVMPFISGGTLATRLAVEDGTLPFTEIATILAQIASALDYAHQQGVIHRDIKPNNILLDEQGKVYLTDFGIARRFDSSRNTMDQAPTSLTMTGEVIGTPAYMAPEQLIEAQVGPTADIYALGIVLYWLVTGRLPFHASNPLATAMRQLHEDPQPPRLLRPALPEPAEAAILCALAKDPAARFVSAGALAQAFEAGVHGRWAEGVAVQYGPSGQGELAIPASPTIHSATTISSTQMRPILSTRQPSRPVRLIHTLPHARLALSRLLMIGIICLAVLVGGLTGLWAVHSSLPGGSAPGTLLKTQSAAHHVSSRTTPSIDVKGNDVSASQSGSGAAPWHFFTQGRVSQPPVVFDSGVYVGTGDGYVYALRTSDGVLLWTYHAGSSVATPLTVAHGVLYFSSVHNYVHALRLDTGTRLWIYHTPSPIISPATVAGGVDYVYTRDGTVYLLQASSGNLLTTTTALSW